MAQKAILDFLRRRWPGVNYLFADDSYDRLKLMDEAADLDVVLAIIRCSESQTGFEAQRRRWVFALTLTSGRLRPGWMSRWLRLVRDYERRIGVSQR